MYTSVKVIIAVLILLSISPSLAESLWVPNSTSLCADTKAKQVGDLVTVIIVESTVSSQQTSTDYNKSLDHSNKQGVGPLMNLIPDLGFSSQQKGSAGGATSMTNKFITKITATVTKVLPNGNLVVTAQRSVLTSGEKQEATLTGTVRPQDVAPDNTVLSTYLADVDLKYTGKGPAGDRQKEGIVSKILKFIF